VCVSGRGCGLSEASGDVVLRGLFGGVGEDFFGGVELDEFAEVEEGGLVADARGLLHVVCDDDDGVVFFDFVDEFLYFECGDGVEGGGGFVHEEYVGLDGHGACDAETLLLSSGEGIGGFVEFVFHFVPKCCAAECLFDALADVFLVFDAVDAESVGYVFVDALGEGVGALEHHAYVATEFIDVDFAVVDVGAIDEYLSDEACAGDEVVHTVEEAQEGGFAASGGADEGYYFVFVNLECDVFEGMEASVVVEEVHVVGIDFDVVCGFHSGWGVLCGLSGGGGNGVYLVLSFFWK